MMVSSMSDLFIDLAALRHNYQELRRRTAPGAGMLAVVKADAYGHGLMPVARTLAAAGADYLGVASLEEGLTLRQAGLTLPVLLLMGILPAESHAAVAHNLEVAVYRQDVAQALSQAAAALGTRARIHLKVDTGMGRLGILPQEVLPFLEDHGSDPHLEIVGLISHLARAEEDDQSYTLKQLEEFTALLARARSRGWQLPLSHLANSAATVTEPAAHFALVRPGIMLYGSPAAPHRPPPVDLKPAMSFSTQVVQLKLLPAGSPISYGGTYTTTGWCRLAVLPVGYCNGYPRALSNCGQVLVRGKLAPIRGRVCMNLIMVEVTHIPGVAVGDPVTLLGADGDGRLTADDLAGWAGTISYEIYCALGTANPRRYIGA